jgi:V/A-type H+-transporting ATPase subunit F
MRGAKVAVVGDSSSVAGFRPLGFAVYALGSPTEARGLWQQLAGGEYGVVFITEPAYAEIEDLVAEVADVALPAVTIIPGAGSPGGVGEKKLARAIEKALGTTVLIREEDE